MDFSISSSLRLVSERIQRVHQRLSKTSQSARTIQTGIIFLIAVIGTAFCLPHWLDERNHSNRLEFVANDQTYIQLFRANGFRRLSLRELNAMSNSLESTDHRTSRHQTLWTDASSLVLIRSYSADQSQWLGFVRLGLDRAQGHIPPASKNLQEFKGLDAFQEAQRILGQSKPAALKSAYIDKTEIRY